MAARAGGPIWPGIGLRCPHCGGGLLLYYVREDGVPWCHWCIKPIDLTRRSPIALTITH